MHQLTMLDQLYSHTQLCKFTVGESKYITVGKDGLICCLWYVNPTYLYELWFAHFIQEQGLEMD